MRTIVVTNQKGGCGKTTTALNLAAALAQMGQRVLIVDLDPQAHATLGLGFDPETLDKTIYHSLVNRQTPVSKITIETKIEGLHLAPSNIRLAKIELELSVIPQNEFILAEQLKKVSDKYDICIVDCPPSLGLLTFNALIASTDIVVPVQVHYYALEGLKQLLETVKTVRKRFYPCSVKILGLLLTFVEDRAALSHQIEEQMRNFFKELVFETVIHRTITLAEAPSAGEPIIVYAPESKGAEEYRALAQEIIDPEHLKKAKEPQEIPAVIEKARTSEKDSTQKHTETSTKKTPEPKTQSEAQQTAQTVTITKAAKTKKTSDTGILKKVIRALLVLFFLVLSAAAVVVVATMIINNPPTAESGVIEVQEDVPENITLKAKDSDRNKLIYRVTIKPSHGSLSGVAPNIIYTPELNYNGPDSLAFIVSDGKFDSNSATVSITVKPVNDLPVANQEAVTTKVDKPVSLTLTGSDVDSQDLKFAICTEPKHGKLSLVQNFATNGKLVYSPDPGFTGTDIFTFKLNDGAASSEPATVAIDVTANNPPLADFQSVKTPEDTPVVINLTGNDPDGDTLNYTVIKEPTHGQLSGTAPNLTYKPNANFNGPDSFTFKVNDGAVDSFVATISITVTAVNDAPTATANKATIQEDTPGPVTLSGSDLDGDSLTYTIVTNPSHGSLSGTEPDLIYTPDINYNGADSFTFRANDGTTDSAPAVFSIEVIPADDPPVAHPGSITLAEDTSAKITLEADDPDGDPLTYSIVRQPSNGKLTGTAPNLTYTPKPNFNWLDSFTFKVNDGNSDSEPATVLITVNPANDPPKAKDDKITTQEDIPIKKIDVLANDTEVDNEPLKVTSVTQGNNGTVSINPDNTLSYVPDADFYGTDSFTYTISDHQNETDTATVSVTVEPLNDAPVITSKPETVAMLNALYTYDVNAVDPDMNDTLTYFLTSKPEGMKINPTTGLIEWLPTDMHPEPNQVTVMVIDSNLAPASDTQSFTIKVNPAPPKIATLTITGGYNQATGKAISIEGIDIVKTSDDKRQEINPSSYISYDFSDVNVPDGTKIKSVIIYVEHYEQKLFPSGKLLWNIGTGWPKKPEIWISTVAPLRQNEEDDSLDCWDVTSFVETTAKLKSMQLQIENKNTQKKTFVDYIYAVVEWDWQNTPEDMVEYKLESVP